MNIDFSAPVHQRDVGWAVRALKNGHKVTRPGWNGRGQYLELHRGIEDTDGEDFALEAFIMIRTVDWTYVPWTPSQTDMLAEDWKLV